MNKKAKEFVKYVKQECKKYGIKCDLRRTKYVRLPGKLQCSGYFDEYNKELVCSMNRPDSIEILAHEFAHLTQWVDQIDLWKKADVSIPKVDDWLMGEEVRDIKKHLAVSRDLELDNEKRAVKIIKKFGLDIDIDQYIKKANCYIHFYNRMLATRKWCTSNNSPYSNKRLVKMMPNHFRMNYNKLPKKIEQVFIEEQI
jgi:hypothetical protein